MQPIKGFQLVLLTIAVSLGIFMNVLDTAIANVAVPTIAGNMGVSADEGTWVITSFTVTMAIMLPLTGWLAKRFGEVRLFCVSALLFTLASVLCGLSTNLPMLIVFRVIQGAVAGPMIPLSQSLLLANYPADKKGLATALWATVAVVAPVVGPIMGGYITDNFTWPWIFYINLPVGLFSVYVTWKILSRRETPIVKPPVDFIGIILLAVGVGCLQILLDKGQDLDWFNSPTIITLIVIVVVSLSFFLVWELTEPNPIVDLSLFKDRNFSIGTTVISLGYMAFFGSVVILPLWLQTQMNYTPTWAGLVTSPFGILAVILSPFMGWVMKKIDLRLIISVGFIFFSICSFWIAGFNTNVNANTIALLRLIQGIGAPCFFIPTITILLSNLPAKSIASGAGISNFFRILAGSFGTSISVALWAHRESIHQSNLVESVTAASTNLIGAVQKLQTLGLPSTTVYARINEALVRQAYMLATNDVFWASGVLFLSLLVLVWFTRPPFLPKGGAAVSE